MISIKYDFSNFSQRICVLPRLLLQKRDGSDDMERRKDGLFTVININNRKLLIHNILHTNVIVTSFFSRLVYLDVVTKR